MLEKCLNCFRSKKCCLCKHITTIDPGIKFVFLMHPQEAYKQRTGTGRIASLSLLNSEIIIDEKFDSNKRVQHLLQDDNYFSMVLYPDKNAYHAESFNFGKFHDGRKLLIFLIDATWSLAKKMMHRSLSLQQLPKLSFSRGYRSEFKFKKQPKDYCLSTIESSYYLIKELQSSGICNRNINTESLLNPFNVMVKYQIDCEKKYSLPIEKE